MASDKNWILVTGALMMALAIALGAFGAHGLKSVLTSEQMAWWQTACLYLFISTLGILVIGALFQFNQADYLQTLARLMLVGVTLFSGSIFMLALGASRKVGMITPIGGITLIISWLYAAWCFYSYS